ncbi:MAG: iron chaperone [Pyrinomonadaceae bacterium]
MKTRQAAPKNIDEYIAGFPNDVQEILEKIRMTIKNAVPDAAETISYQIPTFTLKGSYLIYFAAYKKHIGLYPAPRGTEKFKKELSVYEGGKGTVRFPLDKPIPFGLITRIVKFRVKENRERAKAKREKEIGKKK